MLQCDMALKIIIIQRLLLQWDNEAYSNHFLVDFCNNVVLQMLKMLQMLIHKFNKTENSSLKQNLFIY